MSDQGLKNIALRHPRKLSRLQFWRHVAKDLMLWATVLIATRFGWAGGLVAAALFAVFTFRSFGLMHEAVHSAAHPSRRFNDQLGRIYGVFCYLPFGGWRHLHLEHHRWTGNVQKDPSMAILAKFAAGGYRLPAVVEASWRFWIPLLGFMQHLVFWRGAPGRREHGFVAVAVIYNAAVVALLGFGFALLGLTLYLYMVEVFNFPHHLGLPQYEGEARFPAGEQASFTRSCGYPRWWAHFVLLNFNLHTEHHLFPAHPWYQLDQIRDELLASDIAVNVSRGSDWILLNRRRPASAVFRETFSARDQKAA